jgi:DNA (cytosine-5)-methyltransferase 3A
VNVLSLFDGISVGQQALKELGIACEYYASEIDRYAIAITRKNFPGTMQLGDVRNVNADMIGECDLLIGGSPCQDLSIANHERAGLAGERSGLFFEYVRLLNEIKPKYFILENVNSMSKNAKLEITSALKIEPIMINASLVSAQSRKRLFWVGKLVGNTYQNVSIQLPDDRGIMLKDILEDVVDEKYFINEKYLIDHQQDEWRIKKNICDIHRKSLSLTACYFKGARGNNVSLVPVNKNNVEKMKANTLRAAVRGCGFEHKHNWDTIKLFQINDKDCQANRIYSANGKSVTLSALGGGLGAKTGLYVMPVALRKRGDGKSLEHNNTDKANAITSVQTDSMVMENSVIRKLTPVECERLQSLPDKFTATGINKSGEEIAISNTQRYKCLGNSFNCEVVKHILSKLTL